MKKPLFSLMTSLALLGSAQFSQAQSAASLNFDGTNDVVTIGSGLNATLDALNTITVEAWVKTNTINNLGCIVSNYNTNSNNAEMQFLLRRDGDTYTFWVSDGTGFHAASSAAGTVLPNTWQHVAGSWDGTDLKIYINGALAGTTTGITGANMATTANDIAIGGNTVNEMFSGNIDEVRLWSVCRSAGLISAYMNCNVTDTAAGLLALYNFNEGTPSGFNNTRTTLHNVTGKGNDGTLNGFTLTGPASNYVTDGRMDYFSLQSSVGSLANADRLNNGAAADYDNDQDMDIMVTADNGDPRLYLNDGRGHFSNTYVGGIVPTAGWTSYATGDLNGDGAVDFVTTNQTSTVTAYINNGTGGFLAFPTNLLNGTGAGGVAKIVDLNGDGMLDIIVGNNSGNATDSTEIWINTGSGAAYTDGLSNVGPKSSIATGDVDGDGDVDILTGGFSYAAELFLNNNNNGTFTQSPISLAGGYSDEAMLNDWDMDGDLDIMLYDRYNNAGLRVYYNNGTGSFASTAVLLLQSPTINKCAVKDINGDGFLDVVANHFGGNAYVYISNGCQLALQNGCNYTLDYADNFVELADFDGDGVLDAFCGARDQMSTAHMNYLNVVVTPALSTITSAPDVSTCLNSAAVLTATASNSGTVNWYAVGSGGSSLASGTSYTTAVLSSTTTVSYYAEASNGNGCISTSRDTVNVTVNPLPNVGATATSMTICLTDDDTLNASGATTYTWSSNAASATTSSVVITPGATDTYTVMGTDGNGCVNTNTVSVTVITCSSGIAQQSKNNMIVYPNPSNGNFTLQSDTEIGLVEVYNTLGSLIYKTNSKTTSLQIDLGNEAAGIYYLHAQGKKVMISKQ